MTCISLLRVWVERLRFTLRHDEDDRPFFRHSIENASVAESDATQTKDRPGVTRNIHPLRLPPSPHEL